MNKSFFDSINKQIKWEIQRYIKVGCSLQLAVKKVKSLRLHRNDNWIDAIALEIKRENNV